MAVHKSFGIVEISKFYIHSEVTQRRKEPGSGGAATTPRQAPCQASLFTIVLMQIILLAVYIHLSYSRSSLKI